MSVELVLILKSASNVVIFMYNVTNKIKRNRICIKKL